MKTKEFPYEEFDGVPAWVVVEKTIESLVQNRDLVEQTDRRYVVGFLIKRLHEKGMLTTEAVLKRSESQNMPIGDFSKLARFTDGMASLWFFTATHTHLVVWITSKENTAEQIFLIADGCQRVEASAAWRFRAPKIEEKGNGLIEISDIDCGFRVICETIKTQDSYQNLSTT